MAKLAGSWKRLRDFQRSVDPFEPDPVTTMDELARVLKKSAEREALASPPLPPPVPAKKVFCLPVSAKCHLCTKSVYKVEELLAVGQMWHKQCFTCGGKNNDGCKRVMQRDGYVDHENQPYCTACYSKLFRPKGFSISAGLNTVAAATLAPAPVSAALVPEQPPLPPPASPTPLPGKVGALAGKFERRASKTGQSDTVDSGSTSSKVERRASKSEVGALLGKFERSSDSVESGSTSYSKVERRSSKSASSDSVDSTSSKVHL